MTFGSGAHPTSPAAPAAPALSPARRAQIKRAAEAQIDNVLRAAGIANVAERIDMDGWRYFTHGSARGRAGIIESDEVVYLRVESPVMPLPADNDLIMPLMRELLVTNTILAGSARFGIIGATVCVTVAHPVLELRTEEFAQAISEAMKLSDDFDEHFFQVYGKTTRARV